MKITQQSLNLLLTQFNYTNKQLNIQSTNYILNQLLNSPQKSYIQKLLKQFQIYKGSEVQKLIIFNHLTNTDLTFNLIQESATNLSQITKPNNYYYQNYTSNWIPIDSYIISDLINTIKNNIK